MQSAKSTQPSQTAQGPHTILDILEILETFFSIFVYSRIDINICLSAHDYVWHSRIKETHFFENLDFLEIYLSLFHLFCSKHISLFSNSLWFADFSRIQTSIS